MKILCVWSLKEQQVQNVRTGGIKMVGESLDAPIKAELQVAEAKLKAVENCTAIEDFNAHTLC